LDYFRAKGEVRHALILTDPLPVAGERALLASAGQAANIGILAAAVVALTLAPAVKAAESRGIPPWLTGIAILVIVLGAVSLIATALAGPVSEWIGRAPEIGASIKQKLSVLDQPLASLHELEDSLFGSSGPNFGGPPNVVLPVVAFLTPAAGELVLFFATLLFFLIGQIELRNQAVSMFTSRDSKLRFLKIMHDIERNLAGYLTVVTLVNAGVGTIVAVGTWLIGYPNPVIFGLLAALANYVPYVGPAVMVIVLFGVGLVSFPALSHAVIAPLGLIAVTTMEGHFVTPTIVGRRLTLNPLLVFLALAFWTWMWGPIGAFLAVPLSIVGLVVVSHLFPSNDVHLPE
jgi:predicted PurR-regulated permease PerM